MRSQKDAAFAAFDLPMQDFLLMKHHVEVLEFTPEQIRAVQNGGSEAMKMAKDMPPVSRAAAHAF